MSRFRRRLMGLAALRQAAADDFVRVEYIENTSNAYIDTGYKNGASAWSIDATISFNQIKTCFLYGGRGSSSTRYLQYAKLVGDNFSTSVHMTTVTDTENPVVVDKKYHLNGSVKSLTIDYKDIDEATQEEVDKTFTITNGGVYVSNRQPIYIFACYGVISVANNFNGKLYGFKLYNASGTLVRDFIPMYQISTDTYGLWDRVEEKFYTSPNGVKFNGGERVIADAEDNIYFLKNYVGVRGYYSFADTGIKGTSNDLIKMDIMVTSRPSISYCWLIGYSYSESNRFGVYWRNSGSGYKWCVDFWRGSGTSNRRASTIVPNLNQRYDLIVGNPSTTQNNLSYMEDKRTNTVIFPEAEISPISSSMSYIVSENRSSKANYYVRWYNLEIYKTMSGKKELVLHWIPVQRCSDGVWGFFDKVKEDFHSSQGTEQFTGA